MVVWIANACLIACYALLHKYPRTGWGLSVAGNAIYLWVNIYTLHRIDYTFMTGVFLVLSLWNLWRLLKQPT